MQYYNFQFFGKINKNIKIPSNHYLKKKIKNNYTVKNKNAENRAASLPALQLLQIISRLMFGKNVRSGTGYY